MYIRGTAILVSQKQNWINDEPLASFLLEAARSSLFSVDGRTSKENSIINFATMKHRPDIELFSKEKERERERERERVVWIRVNCTRACRSYVTCTGLKAKPREIFFKLLSLRRNHFTHAESRDVRDLYLTAPA